VTLGALWTCEATSKEENEIAKYLIEFLIHSGDDDKSDVVRFLKRKFSLCNSNFTLDSRFHSSADHKQSKVLVWFLQLQLETVL
jgi:hypothetical protein